ASNSGMNTDLTRVQWKRRIVHVNPSPKVESRRAVSRGAASFMLTWTVKSRAGQPRALYTTMAPSGLERTSRGEALRAGLYILILFWVNNYIIRDTFYSSSHQMGSM